MTRRTWRTLCAGLALASAWPMAAAAQDVVGHLPDKSPYEDVTGKHLVLLQAGYLLTGSDAADMATSSGPLFQLRYEYHVASPLLLTGRLGFAPTLTRRVVDPLLSGPQRDRGTRNEPLVFSDVGFALSLTGAKAWRGMNPRAHFNLGSVSSTNPNYDVGGYRFGNHLSLSYGLSMRGVRQGNWEWNAELTHAFWRLKYPASFKETGSDAHDPILASGSLQPWTGNLLLSVGVSRVLKR